MDVPSQSANDPGELGASGSSPSPLPSWSLARRPPLSHPNTRHCLEICVTLTEDSMELSWSPQTQTTNNAPKA